MNLQAILSGIDLLAKLDPSKQEEYDELLEANFQKRNFEFENTIFSKVTIINEISRLYDIFNIHDVVCDEDDQEYGQIQIERNQTE